MKPLTPEQNRVFEFIVAHMRESGSPPTMREIAAKLGYKSVNNARQHLRLIEQKGYLTLNPGKARGIQITQSHEINENIHEFQAPLIGSIAAGSPITAIENLEGYVTLDRTMFKGNNIFTLRIKGDSMEGIGVLNGDIVIVRQQQNADNGEVVVAIIDGEATLKRYMHTGTQVVLHAENPKYNDIIVESSADLQIAGKLIGVMRKY